jgi:alpha-N-arabinofuranosidase
VRYWNIGNEPYGDWQIGKTSREYFMLKHREFADRMLRRDPSLVLIGSGAMPDQRDPPGVPKVNRRWQTSARASAPSSTGPTACSTRPPGLSPA